MTPLKDADELDVAGFERLINHIVGAGCAGVFVLGTTGEAQALTYERRIEVVRRACEFVRGRVPVLAGISDTSVAESIALGRRVKELGVSAVVTTPPYYFQMSQSDILRQTELLAKGIGLPLFLYNMPGLTKVQYDPETVREASMIEGVVGFKDSSADLLYLQRVVRLTEDRPGFTVLIGPEQLLPQAMSMGVHGGICGGANIWPELFVAYYRAAYAGRQDEVALLQKQVIDISEGIYRIGHPASSYIRGLKGALGLKGICSDLPAPPLSPFTDAQRAALQQQFEAIQANFVVA